MVRTAHKAVQQANWRPRGYLLLITARFPLLVLQKRAVTYYVLRPRRPVHM